MKTIREHLENLPEPERSRDLMNVDKEGPSYGEMRRLTMSASLRDAFSWHDSPEGHYYWLKIYTDLTNSGQ